MSGKKLVIGIDLDGTVWEPEWPGVGKLKPFVGEVIRRLFDAGHTIIIWTARGYPEHVQQAKDALLEHVIPYHGFNMETREIAAQYIGSTARKIHFDVLIDDTSLLGIPDDWEDIYQVLVDQHGIEDTREIQDELLQSER